MAEKIRYNKIIDLLEHGKPVFSTSTVPNGSLDDLTYIADADYDPDSAERPRAQPVGDQAGAGHRRVWSGVAPPEHSGGRPSRSRGGTVSPGAGGVRLCTGWGARLGQSHRLPILG